MRRELATDEHRWTQMRHSTCLAPALNPPRGSEPEIRIKSKIKIKKTSVLPALICVYLCSSVANISSAGPATQSAHPTTQPAHPATGPSVQAASPASVPSLPDDFAILKSRNGFAHGRGGPNGPGAGPQGPRGPEAGLVFRGAVDEADHFTAFIEDTNGKRVMELAPGAPVGRGRIKSIDLDSIVYESGGASKRIEVGQNLEGQVVPPTPTSKPAGPQPLPGPQGPMPPGQGPPGPQQMPPGRGGPVQRAPQNAPVAKPE